MKHRFTIQQLESLSDSEILLILVGDRKNSLSAYTSLSERLRKIHAKLSVQIFEEKLQIKAKLQST